MTEIPFLTSRTMQTTRISQWYNGLNTPAGAPARNATVVQIEHKKNRSNKWRHEFLVITVEYTDGSTRIIAERQNQTDPDQVGLTLWYKFCN
jgi:hypothetical protein